MSLTPRWKSTDSLNSCKIIKYNIYNLSISDNAIKIVKCKKSIKRVFPCLFYLIDMGFYKPFHQCLISHLSIDFHLLTIFNSWFSYSKVFYILYLIVLLKLKLFVDIYLCVILNYDTSIQKCNTSYLAFEPFIKSHSMDHTKVLVNMIDDARIF